nr:hypothetical protein [uncultured Flavobacterium sp.]
MTNVPLLISSVLITSATESNSLTSYKERFEQTLNAIQKIIEFEIFEKIVIVDGSNSKIFNDEEIKYFLRRGVVIEQIAFQQNTEVVKKYGKSFGEVGIINYGILNSRLIKEASSFYKISGRYNIKNFKSLVKVIDRYENVFFFDNPPFLNKGREFVSTIFYKTSLSFYNDNLKDSYSECDYSVRGYLESVYYRRLKNKNKSSLRIQFPLYDAISGTTGKKSVTRFIFLRKIVSRLGVLCYYYPN